MAAHRLLLFLRRRSTCANAAQSTGQLVVRSPERDHDGSALHEPTACRQVARGRRSSCDTATLFHGIKSRRATVRHLRALCSQLRGAGATAGSKSGTSRASGPYVVLCTIGHATVYPAEISHNFTARLPRESRMTLRPPHVRRVISRAENHVMSCMIHTKSRSRGFMGPFRDLTQ